MSTKTYSQFGMTTCQKYTLFLFVFMNIHFYIPYEKFRFALNFELPSPK